MERPTLEQHLFGPGPKRILALDGGGIRGALTLGFLRRMETLLRQRYGDDPDFRLCDYFDLIAGTSTGAIIAAGLALGMPVSEIQEIYELLSKEVFKRSLLRVGLYAAKFPQEPLNEALARYFGEAKLGGPEVRTGLMVMTKRLDTGSPWVLHNNPRGKFFDTTEGGAVPNRDYLIRNIVRASTAAPHYFEPEALEVATDLTGAFVDGGVSPHNNPALQALMLTTLSGYGYEWDFGDEKLLLVSAGTGLMDLQLDSEKVLNMPAVQLAAQSVLSIMNDAHWLAQALLQWMSHSPTAWRIDSELEDLREDILGDGDPLISYLRYEILFEAPWLKTHLGLDFSEEELRSLFAMDAPENVDTLVELGDTAAAKMVAPEHFPAAFDVGAEPPAPTFAHTVGTIARRAGFEPQVMSDTSITITQQVPGGRKQTVWLKLLGADPHGNTIVSISSPALKLGAGQFIAQQKANALLRQNAQLMHGAWVIENIEGDDYLAMADTQIAETIDPAEFAASVKSVAVLADNLEQKFDQDKF